MPVHRHAIEYCCCDSHMLPGKPRRFIGTERRLFEGRLVRYHLSSIANLRLGKTNVEETFFSWLYDRPRRRRLLLQRSRLLSVTEG